MMWEIDLIEGYSMIHAAGILRGHKHFCTSLPKTTPRRKSLDSVEAAYQHPNKGAYQVDEAHAGRIVRFPGFSSMFIDEVAEEEQIPGLAYESKLKGLGLLNGRDKIISDPIGQPEEGFDTGEHEVYTTDVSRYVLGQQHPLIPTLYIAERNFETEIGTIKRMRLGYKGIVPVATDNLGNPVPKGYKRRYSTASQTNQTKNPILIWHRIFYEGAWIWAQEPVAYNYNLDASRVQITDSFLSTEPPDLNRIPGNWQPPNTPDQLNPETGVSLLQPPGQAIITASAEIVKNRPWGWALRSMNADQIFDLPVWLYTLTGEWVPELDVKV